MEEILATAVNSGSIVLIVLYAIYNEVTKIRGAVEKK
jgi:hypothetical protein